MLADGTTPIKDFSARHEGRARAARDFGFGFAVSNKHFPATSESHPREVIGTFACRCDAAGGWNRVLRPIRVILSAIFKVEHLRWLQIRLGNGRKNFSRKKSARVIVQRQWSNTEPKLSPLAKTTRLKAIRLAKEAKAQ
jgi:hypothetical protein